MKSLKIRYLTPICFLIFFMPFLRMCEGTQTIETNKGDFGQVISVPTEEAKSVNSVPAQDMNLNAYQLSGGFFKILFEGKLNAKSFVEIESWGSLCYSFIILNSFSMFILSLLNKFNLVKNLAVANIILLIISTILFIKSGMIEKFWDVKYGFYVFLTYSFIIVYFAKKQILEFITS